MEMHFDHRIWKTSSRLLLLLLFSAKPIKYAQGDKRKRCIIRNPCSTHFFSSHLCWFTLWSFPVALFLSLLRSELHKHASCWISYCIPCLSVCLSYVSRELRALTLLRHYLRLWCCWSNWTHAVLHKQVSNHRNYTEKNVLQLVKVFIIRVSKTPELLLWEGKLGHLTKGTKWRGSRFNQHWKDSNAN